MAIARAKVARLAFTTWWSVLPPIVELALLADARLSRDVRVQVRGERELVSCELEAV